MHLPPQYGTLNLLADAIRSNSSDKGFYTPSSLDTEADRDLMLGKLMLLVTEVAEAAEEVRNADLKKFKEEIADVVIRTLDIVGGMNIDIEEEIEHKMLKNIDRPPKHGKKTSI